MAESAWELGAPDEPLPLNLALLAKHADLRLRLAQAGHLVAMMRLRPSEIPRLLPVLHEVVDVGPTFDRPDVQPVGVPVQRGPRKAQRETRVPLQVSGVTPRQVDVLTLAAEGLELADIAIELHLTRNTVKRHMEDLLRRLGAPNRAAAVAVGIRSGVIACGHE